MKTNNFNQVSETNKFMYKVLRTFLITVILFICFMGRSQEHKTDLDEYRRLGSERYFDKYINANTKDSDVFYAVIRGGISDVKYTDLVKSKLKEKEMYI